MSALLFEAIDRALVGLAWMRTLATVSDPQRGRGLHRGEVSQLAGRPGDFF